MAATVTGAFIVLDRASRPIRKIRDEAIQADLAVKSLGSSLDKVGTREQRNMMNNTASQIRQLAGESEGAAQEAEQLGKRLEGVATPQRTRNINTQAGAITNTGRAARDANRPISEMTNGVRKMEREGKSLSQRLTSLAGGMMGMKAVLIGALIPAIGLAAQGISALGGGVVALLPRLTQLAGLAAPMATGFVGIGLAAITAKLAFSDLGKAMSGNKNALKALTPEAKSFMRTLQQYKPVIADLRKSAQRGLFPGLEVALRRLNVAVPMAKQLLQGMGGRLGSLAAEASKRFTSRGFLQDLQMIGDQGMHVVTQLGRSLINIASGVRHVLVAGLPFTHWLADTVHHLSGVFEQTMKVRRENGSLAQSFSRTQASITTFGHIAMNIFHLFGGVMHAARDTSGQLWDSIDKVTKRWSDWANSTRGQGDMRHYFESIRAPLHQIVGFVGDLVKGLAHMAGGSGFTQAMESLRQAIPALAQGFTQMARTLGPALFETLNQVVQLASTLVGGAGGQGPLMIMLNVFNGILSAVNGLVRAVPGLGAVLAGAFTILGISRFSSKLTEIAGKWLGIARNAKVAQAAEEGALAAGSMAGGGIPGMGRGGGVGRAAGAAREAEQIAASEPAYFSRYRSNVGPVYKGLQEAREPSWLAGMRQTQREGAAASRGVGFATMRRPSRIGAALGRGASRIGARARGAVGAVGNFLPTLVRGGETSFMGLGGRLGAGAMGAAGFVAPLMVLSGVAGAIGTRPTRGGAAGIGQRVAGFSDAATFGLTRGLTHRDDMFTSAAEFDQRSHARALGSNKAIHGFAQTMRRLGGADPTLAQASKQIDYLTRERLSYVTDTSKTGKALYRELTGQLANAKRMLHQQSEQLGSTLAIGFGQAYNIYSRRVGIYKAMDLTTQDVVHKMRALGPQGKAALAQNMIQWAREQADANPKLWGKVRDLQSKIKDEFDKTGRHIRIVNGTILTGSQQQWAGIASAMQSPVEQAKQRMSASFTAIQQEAVGALMTMGYGRGDATNIVAGMEKGGATGRVATSLASNPSLAKNPGAGGALGLANYGNSSNPRAGHAGGGRIPGLGRSDTVHMGGNNWAAPGELVVNHWTENDVNRDLMMAGKPPLGSRVARESRRHNMATGDRNTRGNMNMVQTRGTGLQAGISGVVQRILAQFPGLSITSTTGGGHAANSYHYRGMAADLGGSPELMNQAAAWIGRTMGAGLLEGIHNPNLSIKNGHKVASSFWGPAVWAEHLNHIHVASGGGAMRGLRGYAGGAGGGGAAPQIHLRRLQAALGVPSALVAGGANAYAQGLEAMVNARLQAAGGGGGSPTRGTMSFNAVARLAESVGLPGIAFAQIAKGESGFNPRAVGHDPGGTQGLGLWQITTKYNDDIIKRFGGRNAMFNAHTNALAAKAIYDRAGIGAWYGTKYLTDPTAHYTGNSTGGRVPGFGGWFQRGGSGRFTSPTFIGVGDANNAEHVDVTPIRHSAGRGTSSTGGRANVTVHVHPGAIVIHGADAHAGREAADAFMARLADTLEGMGMESEVDIS